MASGYRPDHDFGLKGELNGAQHEYLDREWVDPGETVRALLWLLVPDRQQNRLHEAAEFTVREGVRVVGRGRITRIMNEAQRHGV